MSATESLCVMDIKQNEVLMRQISVKDLFRLLTVISAPPALMHFGSAGTFNVVCCSEYVQMTQSLATLTPTTFFNLPATAPTKRYK